MNNTMVRKIHGTKIHPKSSFKKLGCAKYAGEEITRANTLIMHFGGETKSQALSWLHRPHSGFLQDGPSLMADDEFLTCQVKTVYMLGFSKTVKSRRWISAVVLTLVCSWAFSCRRRDCSMSGRILRSRAFSTRFRWASPVVRSSWFPAPFFQLGFKETCSIFPSPARTAQYRKILMSTHTFP